MLQAKHLSARGARIVAALVLVTVAAVLSVLRTAPDAAPPAAAPPSAGMLVAIDPETGALVQPTPEQLRELAAAAETPAAGTGRTWVLPDGTVGALVDESLHHYSVLHVEADGKLHGGCLQGDATAPPSLQPGATAAPEE